MKHNPSKLLSLLFAVPFVCMCSKENSNEPASKGEQITITATMSDTKVDLAQGQGELLLTWSEGDALMVIGNTAEKYDIVDDGSGIGTRTATFLGPSVEGEEFTVYYPGTYATVEALTARSYKGQVQTGNGDLGHLEYNSLAQGLSDFRVVNFGADGVRNNGVLKLVVTLPEAVTEVSSISISAPEGMEIFYTTNGTEEKTRTLSLGFENCEIGNDHILTAYMMTSWQDVTIESGTKLTIDVTVPGRLCHYTKTMSKKEDIALNGGACLNIDISNATELDHVLSGSGTEEDPYLLYNEEDLLCIRPILVKNVEQYQYFRMEKNIDMSSIENWVPLNDGYIKNGSKQHCGYINFDGNDKTISNLKCTSKAYASFFGVLIGSVKKLTFDHAVISSNTGSGCGVIGGFIGMSDERYGKAENVTIKNSEVSYSGGGANCAIAFGNAGKADISGITVQNSTLTFNVTGNLQYIGAILGGSTDNKCNISNCSCDSEVKIINKNAISAIGGIVGNIGHVEGEVVDNCTFRGSITPGSATKYVGGIVGIVWLSGSDYSSTLKNCYNYATIDASNCTIIGGITGYMQKGSIENCHNYGNVTGNGTQGGIVGQCERAVNISKCSNSGTITASGNNVGGIVGYLKAGKVSECWYNGNMTVKENSGGIAGVQSATGANEDVIIENCYTAGTITNKVDQKCGGIAGESNKYSKIRNCYSTMSISGGGRVFGSIAGRFNNGQWKNANLDYNMELTNCIAAGSINSTCTTTGYGSSGAVAGNATTDIAHYTNCWRIFGFNFQCAYSAGAGLVDQGYTVTSYTVGTYAGGAGGSVYWNPYHGSAATASALQAAYSGWTTSKTDAQITVSDIAAAINTANATAFASDIWDLSGEHPTLKNNPEPAAE